MMTVANYDQSLVAEFVVAPTVVIVAGRIFSYEPDIDDGSVFYSTHMGDKIHVREADGRLLVTCWENDIGDDSVVLITGVDGSSAYSRRGESMSRYKLEGKIAAYGGML